MAEESQNEKKNTQEAKTTVTPPKRLARAKVKRPQTEEQVKKSKEERKKSIRNLAISAFAVLLVLSMMVPSLASIVGYRRQAQAASQAQSLVVNEDGTIAVDQIDELYQSGVDQLEAARKSNPNDLETLQSLGGQYLSWGYMVGSYAGEAGAEHSAELLAKAQECFDQYLAIEDSADVRVNSALCKLYAGDTATAQEELEGIVASTPDSANAWANLGMIYEMTNPDAAAVAYERAIAADPDDETGSKSFAQGRLDALNGVDEEAAATDEAASDEAAADGAATDEATDQAATDSQQ